MKKVQIATVVCFLSILFVGTIAFFAIPDTGFSEEENRSLRSFPSWDVEKFVSGSYSAEMNEYFADQFPMRNWLVGMKGYSEILLQRGENDGILLGKNGQLAKRLFTVRCADGRMMEDMDRFDPLHVASGAEGILRASEHMDVPMTVLLPPRTLDVAASAFSYPRQYADALAQLLRERLAGNCNYLDMLDFYREKYDAGEAVYFKTDHHWTPLGAYYAYGEILRSLGREAEILPMEAFERAAVSNDFYGTFWSAGGMKFVKPDSLELWLRGNEDSFYVEADGRALDGLYSNSYLDQKDKYSVFLDGTHDVVTVRRKDGVKRERLVIFKDSFANALAPFLCQHFDLVLLNLSSQRTDFTDLSFWAREYDADAVLLIYTVGNLINTDKMNRLQ